MNNFVGPVDPAQRNPTIISGQSLLGSDTKTIVIRSLKERTRDMNEIQRYSMSILNKT